MPTYNVWPTQMLILRSARRAGNDRSFITASPNSHIYTSAHLLIAIDEADSLTNEEMIEQVGNTTHLGDHRGNQHDHGAS